LGARVSARFSSEAQQRIRPPPISFLGRPPRRPLQVPRAACRAGVYMSSGQWQCPVCSARNGAAQADVQHLQLPLSPPSRRRRRASSLRRWCTTSRGRAWRGLAAGWRQCAVLVLLALQVCGQLRWQGRVLPLRDIKAELAGRSWSGGPLSDAALGPCALPAERVRATRSRSSRLLRRPSRRWSRPRRRGCRVARPLRRRFLLRRALRCRRAPRRQPLRQRTRLRRLVRV